MPDALAITKVITSKHGFGGVKHCILDIVINGGYQLSGFDFDPADYVDGSPVFVAFSHPQFPPELVPAHNMQNKRLRLYIYNSVEGGGISLTELEEDVTVQDRLRMYVIAVPGATFNPTRFIGGGGGNFKP